jgi:hypothetical protein
MAMGSDRAANFVIKAKDAATGPLGKIGGAMGRLKSAAGTAFKAIAAGAIAAASAIAGFTIGSIRAAVEDEKAQARLVATLRARGKATDENLAKVEAAIAAGQKLAFTDDDVRASIENATQFTNKFNKALEIQRVAQDLAVAKGIDLASATTIVGKAFAGNGKALKAYGIELTKNVTVSKEVEKFAKDGTPIIDKQISQRKEQIKGMEALTLITEKFGGIAAEVAETNAVKLESAMIALNEEFESFGATFLPAVTEALKFFTENILPAVGPVLNELATLIGDLWEDNLKPLATSFGELFALFDSADFSLLEAAFAPLKLTLDAIKLVIDAIVAGLKLIGVDGGFKTQALDRAAAAAGYGGGSYVNPMNRSGTTTTPSTPIVTNTSLYLDGQLLANSTGNYLGTQTTLTSPSRTRIR